MRPIVALSLCVLFPFSAFAGRPIPPEHHDRHSPNSKFFIDFNPKTNIHVIYAAHAPDDPIWSLESNAFFPYKHDESDGCLFVADDGSSIAGPTWVRQKGKPPDYREFDGLEFWGKDGQIAAYRLSQLRSGHVPLLDFPVRLVWSEIHGSNHRGGNLTRHGNELHAKTFGMRSFTFSLTTGEITGWNLNADYFAYFALVYVLPVWLVAIVARRVVRRWRRSDPSRT